MIVLWTFIWKFFRVLLSKVSNGKMKFRCLSTILPATLSKLIITEQCACLCRISSFCDFPHVWFFICSLWRWVITFMSFVVRKLVCQPSFVLSSGCCSLICCQTFFKHLLAIILCSHLVGRLLSVLHDRNKWSCKGAEYSTKQWLKHIFLISNSSQEKVRFTGMDEQTTQKFLFIHVIVNTPKFFP